jgi:hypothetical protein
MYGSVCFWYYSNFGYWGITHKTGWALSYRLFRAPDRLFNKHNGPASAKVDEYMNKEWPLHVKDIRQPEFFMYAFNLAQRDLGHIEADNLFREAFKEAVYATPGKFIRFTLLRMLGHLDLCYVPQLNHSEFLWGTETGYIWGFNGERLRDKKEQFKHWQPAIAGLESPLRWERKAVLARLGRITGFGREKPVLPDSFKLMPNMKINESGETEFLSCGDGVMGERLWNCLDLDVYFFLVYWGYRAESPAALELLRCWHALFMPRFPARMVVHYFMWLLWSAGILLSRQRWFVSFLSALLLTVVAQAFFQAVFSDNFGGRFALYMRPFLWLGSLCGMLVLVERGYFQRLRQRICKHRYGEVS